MLIKTQAALVKGIEAIPIMIETDVSQGLPAYQIVGQPDAAIKESRERLRLALIYSGFTYPKGRITINMSPAEIRKSGSHFDLAIAVGLLAATEQISNTHLSEYCFLGELSLDGSVKGIKGVLPMVSAMRKKGIGAVIVPQENVREALLVSDMKVYGVKYLEDVVQHVQERPLLATEKLKFPDVFRQENESVEKDFADVKGQEAAKRAIMISTAGGHGLLMMGSPSTGKTMLSERIPGILPDMDYDEIVETTAVYSVAGLLNEKCPVITRRPFRRPHHKMTVAGLLGGGSPPRPGEITLANKGVLFLDEVGEFDYRIMDALRIPLEKKEISLIRHNTKYIYPADFLFVAASNPCPCGYLGDPIHPCKCSAAEITRYQRRFSGPILDRIDMHVHLMPVAYDELIADTALTSAEMRKSITLARRLQKERYQDVPVKLNHQLDERYIDIFACLPAEGEALLAAAYEKMRLNPRTLMKVRKLARTIADLDGCETIDIRHLTEALQYRERYHER